MSSEDFVNALYNGKNLEAEDAFKSAMQDKVGQALEVKSIFAKMDSKPQDFLNTFEKTIQQISRKYRVSEKELMGYFEKEMLTI